MKKIFLLLIVLYACSNESQQYIHYESCPQEKALKGEIVDIPQDLFCTFPSQIELHDSMILILDRGEYVKNSCFALSLFEEKNLAQLSDFKRYSVTRPERYFDTFSKF